MALSFCLLVLLVRLSVANTYLLGNGPLAQQRISADGRERPQRWWLRVSQMFPPQ